MKKILVIEDNSDIRNNICEILELSGYEVYSAEDGKKGIEKAIEVLPDLILCDIAMPEMDGFGVLYLAQHNERLQHTPFIFLSARAETIDIKRGLSRGADDYITKPFETGDLLSRIDYRLRKAEMFRTRFGGNYKGEKRSLSLTDGEITLKNFVKDRPVEKFKKRQYIFTENSRPSRVFYLKKGRVKVYKKNQQNKELIVRIVEEGDFFGYVAMLQDTNYQATAEALDNCDLIAIPRVEFEELLSSYPNVLRKIIKLLAQDVLHMEENMMHIAYNSLRKKVADALLTIYQKSGNDSENINFSRENIAAITGTATESVIRTLSDFKSEKLIELNDGKITIVDLERIKNLSN